MPVGKHPRFLIKMFRLFQDYPELPCLKINGHEETGVSSENISLHENPFTSCENPLLLPIGKPAAKPISNKAIINAIRLIVFIGFPL
jgi:hypothetical protein